jgi:hypothetical protein
LPLPLQVMPLALHMVLTAGRSCRCSPIQRETMTIAGRISVFLQFVI